MTVKPGNRDGDDKRPAAEIPSAFGPLFSALFDVILIGAPLSAAAGMVRADPAAAQALIRCVEASDGRRIRSGEIGCGSRFAPSLLNVLRPMVARQVARDTMGEIENPEAEK